MPATPRTPRVPDDATMPPQELMDLVGITSRTTLWHWDRRGIGPIRYRIDRRTTRYSRAEVAAWLLAGAKRVPREQADAVATTNRTTKKGGDA